MKIFKFGGACIQNPEAIRKLTQFIQEEQPQSLVIVVSAMGKTTQGLEKVFLQKISAQPYHIAIRHVYRFHQDVIDALLSNLRQEAQHTLTISKERLVKTLSLPAVDTSLDELYSRVVAEGELLGSKLIYYYLQENNVACTWLDARKCIKTHSGFYNAQVDWIATKHLVKKYVCSQPKQPQIIITQGFIGSNDTGATTTLGKEGSDFTGAILATVLGAQSLTIWKDVPGIMNADPKLFKQTTKFDHLSYEVMAEMAFYGAKVIHPNAIQPLAAHNIPIYVRPFHQLHEKGTKISQRLTRIKEPIYILKRNQGLVQLSVNTLTFFDEAHLAEVFHQLTKQNIRANMVEKNACMLFICLDADTHRLKTLLAALAQKFKIHYHSKVTLLTVLHQTDKLPNRLLKQRVILLAQQRKGIYQAVFR